MSKTGTLSTEKKRVESGELDDEQKISVDVDDPENDSDTDDSDNQEDDQESTKDDDEDTYIDKASKIYIESFWPSKPETPKGFTFKGKHNLMTFAVKKAKTLLKRRNDVKIGNTKFNILDNRIIGGATQVIIEIVDKEGRGNAIVDFWGPNKRKECTVLVKKIKEHDERFVEIVAKTVVQPILDCCITGGDLKSLLKKAEKNSKPKPKTNTKKKCQLCEKSFMSEKYLNVHVSKIHKAGKNKCTNCDYTYMNTESLKVHMFTHEEPEEPMKVSSISKRGSDSPKDSEKISFEEKRIDDTIMDTTEAIQISNDELAERSKLRDEKIREKERKREEEEQRYNETKRKREENSELKKKTSSKKKKKKKISSPPSPSNDQNNLPQNIRPVPENVRHLVKADDLMLCVKPDGACGFNSTAGHILEDTDQGPKLRRVINRHLCDRWENYKEKYDFPYSRQIGALGEWVYFENSKKFLEYLKNNSKADFLWTDSQELHIVANLYQVDIKIITTKGLEDKNPTINMINPDPELESYALLPKGTIHAMTLIHFENNHFNLVISSKSRLFTNEVNKKPDDDRTNKELQELRVKYENLKQVHEDCLKELEKLKREKEKSKEEENRDGDMEEHDNHEEEKLVAMKNTGFTRIGPQSHSMRKNKSRTLSCPICHQIFISESTLSKHTEKHTTDGDWNCTKCSFQTNSESSLKKHEKTAKHETVTEVNDGIKCNLCNKCFSNEDNIVIHKRNDHRSFKPCKNLPNCPYGTDCMFNHNPKSNKFICYECGEEFEVLRDLMVHRKKKHTMNTCEKFLKNECKRTQETCWYNHENKEPTINESSEDDKKKSQETFQPPVFWERPANLAPPANLPDHATWLKMITMMTELNKMMSELKNKM